MCYFSIVAFTNLLNIGFKFSILYLRLTTSLQTVVYAVRTTIFCKFTHEAKRLYFSVLTILTKLVSSITKPLNNNNKKNLGRNKRENE